MAGVTTISPSTAQQNLPEVVAPPVAPKPAGRFRRALRQAAQSADTQGAAQRTDGRHRDKSATVKKSVGDEMPSAPAHAESASGAASAAMFANTHVAGSQSFEPSDAPVAAAMGSGRRNLASLPGSGADSSVDGAKPLSFRAVKPDPPDSGAAEARMAILQGGEAATPGCEAAPQTSAEVSNTTVFGKATWLAEKASIPASSPQDGKVPASLEASSESTANPKTSVASSSGVLLARSSAPTDDAAISRAQETPSTSSDFPKTANQLKPAIPSRHDAIAAAMAAMELGRHAPTTTASQPTASADNSLGDKANSPIARKTELGELHSAGQSKQDQTEQKQGHSAVQGRSERDEPGPLRDNGASLRTPAAESPSVAHVLDVRAPLAVPAPEGASARNNAHSNSSALTSEQESASQSLPAALPQEPDAASMGLAVHTARLVERFHDSEINLTLRTADFGNIAVHTAMNHERLTAEIAVDRNELGRFLASEAPLLASRLNQEHGIRTTIEVQQQGQSLSGNGGQSQPQQNSQRSPSTHAGERATTMPDIAVTPPIMAVEGRLDIRA